MDTFGVCLLVVAVVAAAVCGLPGPRPRRVEAVARRHSLSADGTAGELLRAYLRRSRRGRAAGVLVTAAGLSFLSYSWWAVNDVFGGAVGPFAPFALLLLLLGYFTGSALAEATWRTPRVALRGADLRPRDLSTYLPTWVPAIHRGVAVLALALLVALVLLRQPAAFEVPISWDAVLVLSVVATALGAELGQRRVLARPQSWPDPETAHVDDVVRRWSQRHLAVAAVGVQLLLLAQLGVSVLLYIGRVLGRPGVAYRNDLPVRVVVPLLLLALVWQRLARSGSDSTGPGR